MKTNEELNELKKEVETVNKNLCELTEEELAEVSGGVSPAFEQSTGSRPLQGGGTVISSPTVAVPTSARTSQVSGVSGVGGVATISAVELSTDERTSQVDGGIVISGVEPQGLAFDYVREAELLPGAQEIFGSMLNHR